MKGDERSSCFRVLQFNFSFFISTFQKTLASYTGILVNLLTNKISVSDIFNKTVLVITMK